MKWLILIMSCCSALAQHPLITASGVDWTRASSAALPIPQQITGLAEWWYFVDSLATNATVTNWVGRIQGTILTNGNSALRPTNSASGIGFTQTQQLTNNNISLGTNWTGVCFFKQTRQGDFSQYCVWGEAGAQFLAGPINQAGSNSRMCYVDHSGVQRSPVSQFVGLNTYVFFALVNSNNVANGDGNTFFYTNGFFSASGGSRETVATQIGTVGYQPTGAANVNNSAFNGFIKHIMVYTNLLTPLNISNLYYYCTNSP